jgi:hypothetical protein
MVRTARSLTFAALFALSATCAASADCGPAAEVHAARLAELHRWHLNCPPVRCRDPRLNVIVVDRFALIAWLYADEGGQSLLEYAPEKGWYRLAHGGGAMGEGILADLTGDDAARKLWRQNQHGCGR